MSAVSSSKVKEWPVYDCTSCDVEMENAFGEQQCDDCREPVAPVTPESDSSSSSDEEEEAPVWVLTIKRSTRGICDCLSWGPFLYRDEKSAKARLLYELLAIFHDSSIFQDAPQGYIEQFFNCVDETKKGDARRYVFDPEYTANLDDINLTVSLVSPEQQFNFEIESMEIKD